MKRLGQETTEIERYDVFLSYADEDKELATRIRQLLEPSGINIFVAGDDIKRGKWEEVIEDALKNAEQLWLLLTENALDRSIWVHHEFGYFYGFHRARLGEESKNRLHYFEEESNNRRPGLYGFFQGTQIKSFNDPVDLARRIALELNKNFTEPESPKSWVITSGALKSPAGFEDFRVRHTSTGAPPDFSYGIWTLDVHSPSTIFNVSAVAFHPEVSVSPAASIVQIRAGGKEQLTLQVRWAQANPTPDELQDAKGRRFAFQMPNRPGPEWYPLYVTFKSKSGEIWASVNYFKVTSHQKGFPEVTYTGDHAPFGWVKA